MHTNAMPVRAFRLITSKQSLSKRHCHTVAYRRTSGGTERDRRESGGSAPGHREAYPWNARQYPRQQHR